MNFGDALRALKNGRAVARKDWPAGVVLVLVPGSQFTMAEDRPIGRAVPELVGEQVAYQTHIDITLPEGVEPWMPTHGHLLAEDWEVKPRG